MSKHAGCGGDEPTAKCHHRISKDKSQLNIVIIFIHKHGTVNQSAQSALYDNGAWEILKQFLTTSMSLSDMDDALVAYLGDRYSEADWVETQHLLFFGDADNNESLRVLMALWRMLAEEEDDEYEDGDEEGDGDGDGDGITPESRMYLLDVQRTVTEYIADYLWKKKFLVTLSAWIAGQLYIVADSPKTIADSLPLSLYAAIKKYSHIMDEECGAVEQSQSTLPNPVWMRIKHGKYKGYIGRIFKFGQDTVKVLLPTSGTSCFSSHRQHPTPSQIRMGQTLKKTVMAFLMQFLHVGNHTRVIKGALHGEHSKGTSSKWLRMCFHVCQAATKEVVEVSKYYLDQCPLSHMLNSNLPIQQHFELPLDSDLIEIGDFIQVLDGEHTRKHGVVDWLSKGDSKLWFRDLLTPVDTESRLLSISVSIAMYMKERGYDVKPGDAVSVAHGPEYGAKGVVQSMDFPNTCLTLICDSDHSLIDIQIRFVIKLHNVNLDYFKKDIGQEVFVIGVFPPKFAPLPLMGSSALLSNTMTLSPVISILMTAKKRSYLAPPTQSITLPIKITPSGSSTSITDPSPLSSSGWTTWSTIPRDVDVVHDPASSINPGPSTSNPWAIDSQDSIDTGAKELPGSMLKVLLNFMGGRLNKRFVSTACPFLR
ncbi:hypothetical protein BDR06DRAFT_974351 [Suillus hirtellus]|nr:hypothetical protein BDR06DRAFT_974351 [Suillus hirtellus]